MIETPLRGVVQGERDLHLMSAHSEQEPNVPNRTYGPDGPTAEPARHLGRVCVDNAALSARMRILAYQYEADRHCVDCTLHRFGADSFSMATGIVAEDREDNPISPVFEDAEWWEPTYMSTQTLECGTCMRTLSVHHADNVRVSLAHEPAQGAFREYGDDGCSCPDCEAAAAYEGPTLDAALDTSTPPEPGTLVLSSEGAWCSHGDASVDCPDCLAELVAELTSGPPLEFADEDEDGWTAADQARYEDGQERSYFMASMP